MTNIERLKLELSNKEYYTNEEYEVFLEENNLESNSVYSKEDNQIKLLNAVIAVLETLSNDVDMMRKIDAKDITSIDQASKYLYMRINSIKAKIVEIEEAKEENKGNIRPIFFTR